MKELVQFKESDKDLIEAFLNLRKNAKQVFDMWNSRFNEIASAWREYRQQIIDELGGSDSEEFDLTDIFYSSIWSMRNGLQSPCNILSSDVSNYDYFLKYIKPIDKLREQKAKRIEKFKKCMKGE